MPDFGHWIFCLLRTDFIKKRLSTKGILIISKLSFNVKLEAAKLSLPFAWATRLPFWWHCDFQDMSQKEGQDIYSKKKKIVYGLGLVFTK